ncbi:hypothetical protein C3L23_03420 [Nautilia sp. PV-1]|uniref:hypothetical protein n=1 Tax=Nautilia sp. PV-1 TaxID=2579250 RepID=UPI000FDB06F5|nr:hypothetical protein [Nautilia sp. PV-1]AZV46353.1 hypothetical protein C3L23_03420 [Nautilia sp. PV-1]
MNLLYMHMMVVFCWGLFMVSLAKSVGCKENSKLLAIISIVFMGLVLYLGTKLMLAMPGISKSGNWLHVKLSIDILAMITNIYLSYLAFRNKNTSKLLSQILYWGSVVMFVCMYYLTLFKPF